MDLGDLFAFRKQRMDLEPALWTGFQPSPQTESSAQIQLNLRFLHIYNMNANQL